MQVHTDCSECEADIAVLPDSPPPERCPQCDASLSWNHEGFADGDYLNHCLKCGREEFYEQNQINPNFGVTLVVAGAVAFGLLVYWIPGMNGFLWGTVVLLSLAVFDRLLRLILPEVVICYHCATVYRNVDSKQNFEAYDHERAIGAKYSDD